MNSSNILRFTLLVAASAMIGIAATFVLRATQKAPEVVVIPEEELVPVNNREVLQALSPENPIDTEAEQAEVLNILEKISDTPNKLDSPVEVMKDAHVPHAQGSDWAPSDDKENIIKLLDALGTSS